MAANSIHHRSARGSVPLATLVIGAVAGSGLSSLGLILPWLAACVAAIIAAVLGRQRVLVFLALGLALGALAFLGLGLVWNLIDDPSSASGSS
jgi:hypothetical protein